MSHVLLVAGALIFEADWDRVGSGFVPERLARRLTRARCLPHVLNAPWSDGAADLHWLARAFAVPGNPPACAPYAWQAASGEPPAEVTDREVWFCEPVHLSLEPERTVLAPIDTPALSEQELGELFASAADSAREHDAELRQADGRWYLFPAQAWQLQTTALAAALGASIEARLPQGPLARQWRRLLNDVQMRWHANAINRRRDAERQQVANGLWLHSGGPWRALGASRFARVETDDSVVKGWQQAAQAAGGHPTDRLTVWPHLFEAYWRRDWTTWAAGWVQLDALVELALRQARSAPDPRVELVACGRRAAVSLVLGEAAGLLPWRRRPLRDCLLELAR
jgi:hypothetical protein